MRIAIAQAISQLRQMYPPGPPQPFAKAIIGLLVGTLLLAVLFYSLERLFPEQAGQTFIRKGTRVDALYCTRFHCSGASTKSITARSDWIGWRRRAFIRSKTYGIS